MMDVENFMGAPSKLLMVQSHLEREMDSERRRELLEYQGMLHFVLQQFAEAETPLRRGRGGEDDFSG